MRATWRRSPPPPRSAFPSWSFPAHTAIVRLQTISPTSPRPALRLALKSGGRTTYSELSPLRVPAHRPANADFPIAETPARPASRPASLCVSAQGWVRLGGTPLTSRTSLSARQSGAELTAQVAIWYMPRAGADESYLSAGRGDLPARGAVPAGLCRRLDLPCAALSGAAGDRAARPALPGPRTRRTHPPPRALAVRDRRRQLLLLGADHARLPGARRGRPLRIHPVGRQRGEKPSAAESSPLPRWSSSENARAARHELPERPSGGGQPPAVASGRTARRIARRSPSSTRRPTTAAGIRPRPCMDRSTTSRWPPRIWPPRMDRCSRS